MIQKKEAKIEKRNSQKYNGINKKCILQQRNQKTKAGRHKLKAEKQRKDFEEVKKEKHRRKTNFVSNRHKSKCEQTILNSFYKSNK